MSQGHGRDHPDQSDKIAALWDKGLCASQIAERLNVSRETIDLTLRAKGLTSASVRRTRYDGAGLGGSGRSGFAANMARRT